MRSGGKLARYTGLRRFSRLPQVRATPRRSSRTTDQSYLQFLRNDTCGVALILGHERDCWGPIDPEHEREGVGIGQTASDDRAWSCCRSHHRQRHDLNGYFKGWPRERLRLFIQQRITVSRTRYANFLATGEHQS